MAIPARPGGGPERKTMKATRAPIRRVLLAGNQSENVRRGLCEYARKAGWVVLLTGAGGESPRQLAATWNAAGILAAHAGPGLSARTRSRVPVVLMGHPGPSGGGFTATLDDRAIGRLAAEHFLEARFTHLAYCYWGGYPWTDRQREGFESCCRRGGARFHLLDFPSSPQARRVYTSRGFRRWLAGELLRLPKPLGLLLDSDWTGLEALEACMEAGLAVPEEVALVGVGDNVDICESLPVPLSSIRVNGYEQGYRASELLDAVMSGRRVRRRHVVVPPGGIVVRQSSNIIAVPHVPTARALRYIWDHLADPRLTPEEVARAVALSRRALDMHFAAHLGRPVAQEISSARLTQAMILLSGTGKTVTGVARETGFASALHLRRTFARAHARPLQEWRKQARADRQGQAGPDGPPR